MTSSTVGLGSTSYGDVRLRRLETISRETDRRVNDASGENELNIAEAVDNYYDGTGPNNGTEHKQVRPLFQNFGTRIDNAISYRSPSIGGLQGVVTIGLSENYKSGTAGVPVSGDTHGLEYRGLGAIYNLGPFNAAVSYEEVASNKVRGGSFDNTVTVGANYDFGMAVLYLAYQNSTDISRDALSGSNSLSFAGAPLVNPDDSKGVDHEAFNVGVKVPVGNFTFKVQYTESNISGLRTSGGTAAENYAVRGGQLKQYKYGGIVSYAFSKRTSVYAVASARGGDGDQYFQRKNEYAIGIGHNF